MSLRIERAGTSLPDFPCSFRVPARRGARSLTIARERVWEQVGENGYAGKYVATGRPMLWVFVDDAVLEFCERLILCFVEGSLLPADVAGFPGVSTAHYLGSIDSSGGSTLHYFDLGEVS